MERLKRWVLAAVIAGTIIAMGCVYKREINVHPNHGARVEHHEGEHHEKGRYEKEHKEYKRYDEGDVH